VSDLKYVNVYGDPIKTKSLKLQKGKAKAAPTAYHKGWQVVGYPPGFLGGGIAFDPRTKDFKHLTKLEAMKAYKLKKILKPYSILEAAQLAAQLAVKSGYEYVSIVEKVRGRIEDNSTEIPE
jgi:hypothetical protein